MPAKNIVVLDGTGPNDKDLLPTLDVLSAVLRADDASVQTFPLRDIKLAHCLGCFNCWIKTPGICVENDAGREIARAVIHSDVTVFFTPVTFGGYSPELKKMLDRFLQLVSPFFRMEHGEVHHPPRYVHRPRLVSIGVQRRAQAMEALIFKTLAGRNAINFHPPSYAAEVVLSTDSNEALRQKFETLLRRSDSLPFGEAAASLMPPPVLPSPGQIQGGPRRALLIVGSPKNNEPSTSAALGTFLLERLSVLGWEVESATLRASLQRPEGVAELISAIERAGLILLVFPLYVDALPYLVTKALATIATKRSLKQQSFPQRFVAIVNSGFPEPHQNALALALCREFASQCGFTWAGSLAFGGGGMIGGQPLSDPHRSGPPVKSTITALEMTAKCLADGLPVPAAAVDMVASKPLPTAVFNRFYLWMAGRNFEKLAAKQGVTKAQLRAQPYAS